jgi:hypothetical protein
MNVYRSNVDRSPDRNDKICRFMLVSDDDRRMLNDRDQLNGRPTAIEQWVPWKIQRAYTTPGNLDKPLGDRAGIDFDLDPMVLSRRALDVLLPHIGSLGQVLPLAFDECEYNLFNITNVVDALDEPACDVWRFPSSGRIGDIERYVFRPEVIRDQWLFKIPQKPTGFAFVTDRFIEVVQRAGLTGFGFEPLWSDEAPSDARAA